MGNSMYRVVIIDDEPWVIKGLERLINWEVCGFQIIGTAFNGVTGFQLIEEKLPDVIFSDIRMAGVNGIELVQKLREKEIYSEVVLISGYTQFEYAKQALKLGVFDYLIKQIKADQLLDVLNRIKVKFDQQKVKQEKLLSYTDDLYDILRPEKGKQIGDYAKSKGLLSSDVSYILLNIYCQSETIYCSIQEILNMNASTIHTKIGKFSLMVICIVEDNLRDTLENVFGINDILPGGVQIGVSSIGDYDNNIARMYEEAEIALLSEWFRPTGKIRFYYPKKQFSTEVDKYLNDIKIASRERNFTVLSLKLSELKDFCISKNLLLNDLVDMYNKLMLIHKYFINKEFENESDIFYRQLVDEYAGEEEMFDALTKLFLQSDELSSYASRLMVNNVLNEISKNYMNDISVGALSAKYGTSQGYLSHLIKVDTGQNFTDHLNKIRMDKAKELLSYTEKSIYEIADETGFKDYYYFIKVFKKLVGISPSKFRKTTMLH